MNNVNFKITTFMLILCFLLCGCTDKKTDGNNGSNRQEMVDSSIQQYDNVPDDKFGDEDSAISTQPSDKPNGDSSEETDISDYGIELPFDEWD